MLNGFTYWLPDDIESRLEAEINNWESGGRINSIWDHDASVWTGSGEEQWLGWLDIPEKELADAGRFKALFEAYRSSGFEDVVLLGMGGSSLCPEVLAITFDIPNFHILDSTVPAQLLELESRLNIGKTLFIVASKSGSTLEPNAFKQYFYKKVSDEVGPAVAGKHFVAITDPGSKLESLAKEEDFREVYYGEPTVGGRFSALTVFGLIPAAFMGIDVEDFLSRAVEMSNACKSEEPARNPGALLGLILGVCHAHGRDKLTIFTSPEIYDVGAWMEQLVAESTGKNDVAIIPVDREPALDAGEYGADRLFALLTLSGDRRYDQMSAGLKDSGQPYVQIDVQEIENLGQEFFRWEFATAVAGSVMEINPFDQPDVEAAKIEAKKLTEAFEETGELPAEEPFLEAGGFSFYGDLELAGSGASGLSDILKLHLDRIAEDDYFALLAYVEMDARTEQRLQSIREAVLRQYKVATCLGFGPRFLHSTGQAYKGGPGTGVFLQITSGDVKDIGVPGQDYTFGVIKSAQSRGDFQVLVDRGRRALRIHISGSILDGLVDIAESLP